MSEDVAEKEVEQRQLPAGARNSPAKEDRKGGAVMAA